MNKVFVGIALFTYLDNPHKIQFLPRFNYGMALLMTYHKADRVFLLHLSLSLSQSTINPAHEFLPFSIQYSAIAIC